MKKNPQNTKEGQEGISVLLAIVITAIVLVIGVTISSLVIGELGLSRSADRSVVSFYAANAGMEQALHHCRKVLSGGSETFEPGSPAWNPLVLLDGQALSVVTGTCDDNSADITSTGLYPCSVADAGCTDPLPDREQSRRSIRATY